MTENILKLSFVDFSPTYDGKDDMFRELVDGMKSISEKYATAIPDAGVSRYVVGKVFSDYNLKSLEQFGKFDPVATTVSMDRDESTLDTVYDVSFELVLNSKVDPQSVLRAAYEKGVDKPELLVEAQ